MSSDPIREALEAGHTTNMFMAARTDFREFRELLRKAILALQQDPSRVDESMEASPDTPGGRTLLHFAAGFAPEFVEPLLQLGADPNRASAATLKRPLHCLALYTRVVKHSSGLPALALEALSRAGADPTARTVDGKTAENFCPERYRDWFLARLCVESGLET
jgi:hypothetical protein